jgi:ribosomal protein S27E
MPATISISCPKCKKSITVPEELKGKKIKCKGCGEVLSLPGGPPEKGDPRKPANAPADGKQGDDEEWGIVKAYGVTKESDLPRCPFCAWELESDTAVVCLHCGYNLQTRERLQEKVLQPVTGGDYFLWLLPGMICVAVALFFVGLIVVLWTGVPDLSFIGMRWVQEMQWTRVYGSVLCGFAIWFSGFFAVRRLILRPHPPEKEKKKKKQVV